MSKMLFIVLLPMMMLGQKVSGEDIYPEIGKKCPDFSLRNIKYFNRKQASLGDFKGKWLVLDFWNKTCGACIASFPKTSALQKEYGANVQFMLVGIEDKEGQIGPMYDKFQDKGRYAMPCAFDSSLANKWDIYTAPYIIIIDPTGKVAAITFSIDAEVVHTMLEGEPLRLPRAYRMHEDEPASQHVFDRNGNFLIRGNGGNDSDFLFRSILSVFDNSTQTTSIPEDISEDMAYGKLQILGVPLYMLYDLAYLGRSYPDRDSGYERFPILDIRDSTPFKYSELHNRNMFCYALNVPPSKATREKLQRMMQRDLENYFSYSAVVEDRQFPCLKLVASDSARQNLKTKGGKPGFRSLMPKGEFIMTNLPFGRLTHLLQGFNNKYIIDGSGITGNIDIHMDCLLSDVEDVKRALRANGLDLVAVQKSMKVLVIRDNSDK